MAGFDKIEQILNIKVTGASEINRLNKEIERLSSSQKKLRKSGEQGTAKFSEQKVQLKGLRSEFNKASKEVNRLATGQKKASSFTGKLTSSMLKMTIGVGAAVKAYQKLSQFMGSSISVYKGFDFTMHKVKAITGATTGEYLKMRKAAQDLGRTTFFTAEQVAQLQLNLSKMGFTTKEVLDSEEAILRLAEATGEDLARSATVLASTIRGFGLDATEAGRVADVMGRAFTGSALDLEKWQTSMTKVAPVAKIAGFSIEETAAVMASLTDAGIEASIAGTSLRNIFLKLGDPSSDLTKKLGRTVTSGADLAVALKELRSKGISIASVLEDVDLRQAAAWGRMLDSVDGVEKFTKALENSSGAVQGMSDTINQSLEGAFKRFTSAFQGFQISFMDRFGEGIGLVVDKLTGFFNMLSEISEIKISTKMEEDRIAMNNLFDTLNKTNITQDTRKRIIEEINSKYEEYLPNLIDEKTAVEDLETAQINANAAFEQKINLMAAEETLSEIRKRQLDAEILAKTAAVDETRLLTEQTELLIDTDKRASESRQGFDNALETNKQNLTDARLAQKEAKAETEKLKEEYKLAAEAVLEFGGAVDGLPSKSKKTVVPSTTVDGEDDAIPDATPIEDLLLKIKMQEQEIKQQFIDGVIESEEEMNQEIRKMKIREMEWAIKHAGLEGEALMEIEKKLMDARVANKQDDQKSEIDRIKSMKETGKLLMQIGEQEGKNSQIRKAGIKITQAAAVAEGIKALMDSSSGIAAQAKLPFPANIIAMAATAAQVVSVIANVKALMGGGEKFANGGLTNGGMFEGASHANGGVKFAVGGRIHEAEGGEAIINKRSTSMFKPLLSAINSHNSYGKKFALGGLTDGIQSKYAIGGMTASSLGDIVSGGGMGGSQTVMVVESDITRTQSRVSAIEAQASF